MSCHSRKGGGKLQEIAVSLYVDKLTSDIKSIEGDSIPENIMLNPYWGSMGDRLSKKNPIHRPYPVLPATGVIFSL